MTSHSSCPHCGKEITDGKTQEQRHYEGAMVYDAGWRNLPIRYVHPVGHRETGIDELGGESRTRNGRPSLVTTLHGFALRAEDDRTEMEKYFGDDARQGQG